MSLAYFLSKRSDVHKLEVYDKSYHLGGLLWQEDGADLGPHYIFGNQLAVTAILEDILDGEYKEAGHSKLCICSDGIVTGFPFQYNLQDHPSSEQIIHDYESNKPTPPINLMEWFRSTFGNWMSGLNFEPYNTKMWDDKLPLLAANMSERMESERDKITNNKPYTMPTSYYPTSEYGIFEIIRKMYQKLEATGKFSFHPHNFFYVNRLPEEFRSYDYVVWTAPAYPTNNYQGVYLAQVKEDSDAEVVVNCQPDVQWHRKSQILTKPGWVQYESMTEMFDSTFVPDAYPIPFRLKYKGKPEIDPKVNVVLHGRQGLAEYWNMDKCVLESMKLSAKL